MAELPLLSEELPPRPEPGGELGLYAHSGLKVVTGTRANPLAKKIWYTRREELTSNSSRVITAAHPQLAEWINILEGLDPEWSLHQPPLSEWPLSRVIPRVKVGPNFPDWEIPAGSYWFDYSSITGSLRRLPSKPWTLELASRLPEGSTAILGGLGTIAQRLAMWRLRKVLFRSAFIRQFDAVVCPDFSSYLDDPRPQGLVGERMTQLWAAEAEEAGLRTIPIVSWQDRDALRWQADLLGSLVDAGQVNTVYLELLARGVRKKPWLYSRLDDIQAELAHLPVRWLLSGADAGGFIGPLREVLPQENFHLVTLWPWMRTGFQVGLREQKAADFRRRCQRLEEMAAGQDLPPAMLRPPDMTMLQWQEEEEGEGEEPGEER